MKIKTAQYIAKKQNGSYSVSAYRYQETSNERSFQKGDLYCLLSLESEEDIQATTLSKFVWDGILDAYLYSEAKTANEAITDALEMGEKKVRDLIKNDKDLESSGVNLNFTIVANRKEGFYVGVYGDMEVFVYREGNFVCISEVLKKNSAKTAGVVLKKDEMLAISTPELFSAFVESFDNKAGAGAIEESLRSIDSSLEGLEGILTLRVEEEMKIRYEQDEYAEQLKEEISPGNEGEGRIESLPTRKTLKELRIGKGDYVFLDKLKEYISVIGRFFKKVYSKIKTAISPLAESISQKFSKQKAFKKVGSKVSEIRFKHNRKRGNGIRVDGYKARNLKKDRIKIVVIASLVIISIILLVRFILNKKQEAEIHDTATEQFSEIEGLLESAEGDIVKDKNEAESSLYLADEIFKGISSEISEEDSKIKNNLYAEYIDLEDQLLSRKAVSENDSSLIQFLDTRLAFGEKSDPTDILYYKDTSENEFIYISDKGSSSVFRISIYDKDVKKVPDDENLLKTPEYIDYGNEGLYTYDSSQGVLKAPFSDSFNSSFQILTGVKARDLDNSSIAEMAILTETDNIYLLSKTDGSILKSSRSGSGYGLTYPYVESETFANASDFFSDFTIYVLRPGSDGLETYIYNYLEFKYEYSPLKLMGLRTDLEDVTKGYTSGSLDFGLYVFDANQKRFIKFEKPQEDLHPGELVLKQQYVYRGDGERFAAVKDFVVDANEEYAYILDGKTVWRISL